MSRGLVLMYHRIAQPTSDAWGIAVSPSRFAQQMEWVTSECNVVSLRQVARDLPRGQLPDRWVAVSFDDGYADNLLNAKPILDEYGIPATIFAVTGMIGSHSEFWWDEVERVFLGTDVLPDVLVLHFPDGSRSWTLEPLGEVADVETHEVRQWRAWEPDSVIRRQEAFRDVHGLIVGLPPRDRDNILNQLRNWAGTPSEARPEYRVMTQEELLEVTSDDGIEIGSHTVTHTPLHLLSGMELRRELIESKTFLQRILGRDVASLSYPFGSHLSETMAAVKEAGYAYACASLAHEDVAGLTPGSPRAIITARTECGFEQPRIMIEDWDGPEFGRRLQTWFGD